MYTTILQPGLLALNGSLTDRDIWQLKNKLSALRGSLNILTLLTRDNSQNTRLNINYVRSMSLPFMWL